MRLTVMRPCQGVSQVACRNFKMSRVGVLSRLHNAVGNLATYIWLRQSFVAISFESCRYFFAHVACRNLPWQGLCNGLMVCLLDSGLKIPKPLSIHEKALTADISQLFANIIFNSCNFLASSRCI